MNEVPLQLFDPRLGQPALKVEPIGTGIDLESAQRFNYFTIVWVREGSGTFSVDLAHHPFEPHSLLFSVPYQMIRIEPCAPIAGVVIQFHANFFCIETYHEEVGCNGVLFNDCSGLPLLQMDEAFERQFAADVEALRRELREAGLAHSEALVSYLKILLIRATRAKLQHQGGVAPAQPKRPEVLNELRALIESRYRELRQPSEYAELLHVSPKTLAKTVKTHLHTTLTELIRERVMRQAKWEMLHTTKPVKQVARELGFADVFYFSRLFKRATGCSPRFFREYETEIRGGRNLSMESRQPSMVAPASPAE